MCDVTKLTENDIIQLQAGDDPSTFSVMAPVALMSETLKGLIEDVGTDMVIPLPNVDGPTLEKILTWCKHHYEAKKAASAPPVEAEVEVDEGASAEKKIRTNEGDAVPVEKKDDEEKKEDTFDATFLAAFDQMAIFSIINASNYMDIPELMISACKSIAAQIRGKKPEEIRKIFNITNDFTPEEEERVRNENIWVDAEEKKAKST
jgi:S-phase kinase-associated protein 1